MTGRYVKMDSNIRRPYCIYSLSANDRFQDIAQRVALIIEHKRTGAFILIVVGKLQTLDEGYKTL